MLGSARYQNYLMEAAQDQHRAEALYLWSTELSGALHAQLSYAEIAVRNAIDRELRKWNVAAGLSPWWTAPGQTESSVHDLIGRNLVTARSWAEREATDRAPNRPASHDDVVAQLMFGAWVKLIRPMSAQESSVRQRQLWHGALHQGFGRLTADDRDRQRLGDSLERLRRLRNRVAHHDSLLGVDVRRRLNDMLSLLAKIDPTFPPLAMGRSHLRRLAREDPRRAWSHAAD